MPLVQSKHIEGDERYNNDLVVFIVGAGSSGTTLLLSLLDGHPDIFAFPFELKFHKLFQQCVGGPENFADIDKLNDYFLSDESKMSYLKKDSLDLVYNAGKLDFTEVDFDKLESRLRFLEKGTYLRTEYFKELAVAFMEACGIDRSKRFKILLEKSGNHGLDFLKVMSMEFFGNMRLIHVVRNPLDNIASAKLIGTKHPLRHASWKYNAERTVYYIKYSMEIAARNYFNPTYMILSYESLCYNLTNVMHKLCDKLGIVYNSSLLEPTILGHRWTGNSSSDKEFKGVTSKRINIFSYSKLDHQELAAGYGLLELYEKLATQFGGITVLSDGSVMSDKDKRIYGG